MQRVYGGRHDSLMVSVLNTGSSRLGSGPDGAHCVVFFGLLWQDIYSHSASLHPGVQMDTGNLTECWGVTCDELASHPGGSRFILQKPELSAKSYKPVGLKRLLFLPMSMAIYSWNFFMFCYTSFIATNAFVNEVK